MRGIVKAAYALGISAALLTPAGAHATGYAIREQSGSMLGQAFAGANAYSTDPSIIFFNPAGMSALDGTRASAAVSYIHPKNEFDNDGSTSPIPLGTDDGGDAGQDAIVPAFYGMTSLGAFRVGIGVNAPFGLSTEYNNGWIGRYAALDSRLLTINVNPVVSYQVLDWLAIGAGVQIENADARLTNAAFFGALGDGDLELQADDDVAFGFTAGALITPWRETKIGIGFRSSVHHDLDGKAQVHVPVVGTTNMDASAKLDTPESLGLSIYQRVTDRLSLVGTVEWTNWSRFDELRVKFDTPGVPDSVTGSGTGNATIAPATKTATATTAAIATARAAATARGATTGPGTTAPGMSVRRMSVRGTNARVTNGPGMIARATTVRALTATTARNATTGRATSATVTTVPSAIRWRWSSPRPSRW